MAGGEKLSSDKRKYHRTEKAEADRQQTSFSLDGSLKSKIIVKAEMTGVPMDKQVMCPFCLKIDKLQRFLISGKDGISHSRAQCPMCSTGMLMRSLLKEFNPGSYADWVFGYRGFFHKVDYASWKNALAAKGWADAFWARHGKLKAEKQEYGVSGAEAVSSDEDLNDLYEAQCQNARKEASGSA